MTTHIMFLWRDKNKCLYFYVKKPPKKTHNIWSFIREISREEIPYISTETGCLFELRFCSPVNPKSCRVRSVYLSTLILSRLSPLGG